MSCVDLQNLNLEQFWLMVKIIKTSDFMISVIPQSSLLFSTSLRDNFDPFRAYSDDKIRRALGLVNLSNLIHKEKGGLDLRIGNKGIKLSAWKKQLIYLQGVFWLAIKLCCLMRLLRALTWRLMRPFRGFFKMSLKGLLWLLIEFLLLLIVIEYLWWNSGECVEFESTISFFEKKDSYFIKLANSAGSNRAHFESENRYNTELDQNSSIQ